MGLDELRAQHRRLLASLSGLLVDSTDAIAWARYAESLTRHLVLEEEHLVPPLTAFLPRETGPIAVLVEDHATIRQALDDLSATRSATSAGRLMDLFRQHCAKEEELLYPFAESHLSPEDLARLGSASSSPSSGSAKRDDH